MKYIQFIILFLFSCISNAQDKINLQSDLLLLDSVITNYDKYSSIKEYEIQALKKIDIRGYTARQQIDYYQQLYKSFLRFSPDSAFAYIEKSTRIAEANMLPEEQMLNHIYMAQLFVLKGDFDKQAEVINKIKSIEQLPKDLQEKMAIVNMEKGIRLNNFNKRDMKEWFLESEPLQKYWQQYEQFIPKNNWEYEYFKALLTHNGNIQTLLKYAEKVQSPSIDKAMIYYAVACIYKHVGMKEEFLHYVILSACQDIMSANRESHALLSILHQGIIEMDDERALNYVRICAKNAQYYKDFNRSLPILETYDEIANAYVNHRTYIIHNLVAALAVIFIAVIIIVLLLRNLKRKRNKLLQAMMQQTTLNERLQQKIIEIDLIHKNLQKAIKDKQCEIENGKKYFLNVFQVVSQHLNKEEANYKEAYNWLTIGKTDKAKSLMKKGSASDAVLKQLYEQFDKMFLLGHPDFVQRINALLKPEEQIVTIDAQSLTPELRICALISIGITDSVSIAELLRYSTQTVYNYRLKIRKKAIIPENSFANTVRDFYS